MGEMVEMEFTDLKNCRRGMHRLIKGPRIDCKEVEGGKCMRGSDGK